MQIIEYNTALYTKYKKSIHVLDLIPIPIILCYVYISDTYISVNQYYENHPYLLLRDNIDWWLKTVIT